MKNMKKLGKNGGFYIALCGCAAVVALVGYVGDLMKNKDTAEKPENIAMENFVDYEDLDEPPIAAQQEEKQEPEVVVIEPEPETTQPAEETAAKEEVDEFLPIMPASGKVVAEFSGGELVKFEKLGDWRTHSGIDIEAKEGDDAYVCENGVVEKIYSNNMGGCILIDHQNGYKSLYANLGETDLVNVGDELHCGETVGRVGTTAVGDLTDGAHLHFEMYKDDKAINPLEIITVE